jgi:anti-sigma factor ChrR (cupin superfamily)
MSSFAKQPGCPTSATLSAYSSGTLSFLARPCVAEHLAACEFCVAELSLLAACAPAVETLDAHRYVAPQMPLALRLLAESMLSEMHAAERRAA